MKVLITGSSSGIGEAAAKEFLAKGHEVIGFDKNPASLEDPHYTHYQIDLKEKDKLPLLEGIDIIVNNAGEQNGDDDIDNNLKTAINVTEKYAFHEGIKSVLFNASASATSGFEFPQYVASKAGMVGYMRNVAVRLAKFGATANSLSLGGVITSSNSIVMDDPKAWDEIMKVTPLKKWMSLDEVAAWVYFLTVTNRSMSGEDILIDNGEYRLNSTFVWPENKK